MCRVRERQAGEGNSSRQPRMQADGSKAQQPLTLEALHRLMTGPEGS